MGFHIVVILKVAQTTTS